MLPAEHRNIVLPALNLSKPSCLNWRGKRHLRQKSKTDLCFSPFHNTVTREKKFTLFMTVLKRLGERGDSLCDHHTDMGDEMIAHIHDSRRQLEVFCSIHPLCPKPVHWDGQGWMAPAPDLEKTVIDENEKGFPYNGKGEEAWYMGTSSPLSFTPTLPCI